MLASDVLALLIGRVGGGEDGLVFDDWLRFVQIQRRQKRSRFGGGGGTATAPMVFADI